MLITLSLSNASSISTTLQCLVPVMYTYKFYQYIVGWYRRSAISFPKLKRHLLIAAKFSQNHKEKKTVRRAKGSDRERKRTK